MNYHEMEKFFHCMGNSSIQTTSPSAQMTSRSGRACTIHLANNLFQLSPTLRYPVLFHGLSRDEYQKAGSVD